MQKACIIFSFTLAIHRHNIHAYYIYIYKTNMHEYKNIYILIKKKKEYYIIYYSCTI